jgi:hypothetical protein
VGAVTCFQVNRRVLQQPRPFIEQRVEIELRTENPSKRG